MVTAAVTCWFTWDASVMTSTTSPTVRCPATASRSTRSVAATYATANAS